MWRDSRCSFLKLNQKKLMMDALKKNKIPRNKPTRGGKRPVLGKLQDTDERN